jgi:predicted RNA-binding protein with PUA-like domain
MKYWLMKTEPEEFSIDDLQKRKTEAWNGVRNYQARNFMRDEMKLGDLVLIYHSNCDEIGIAGIAKVCKLAYPDHTARDKKSDYYDPKSTIENPIWVMVDVAFEKKFPRVITLKELKEHPKLSQMRAIAKGNRLSITPVLKSEFDLICEF